MCVFRVAKEGGKMEPTKQFVRNLRVKFYGKVDSTDRFVSKKQVKELFDTVCVETLLSILDPDDDPKRWMEAEDA